jgi:hypothetical protein
MLISDGGYQIPVYILSSPHSHHRMQRITRHIERSKFTHVYYREDFPAGRIPKSMKKKYFVETLPAHMNGSSPLEIQQCADALVLSVRNKNKALKDCREKGSFLSEKEISFGLKHIKFHEAIVDCARTNSMLWLSSAKNGIRYNNNSMMMSREVLNTSAAIRGIKSILTLSANHHSTNDATSTVRDSQPYTFLNGSDFTALGRKKIEGGMCLSPGTSNTTRYALILEDDELLSLNLLRELLVMILSAPEDAGMFMLDDMLYANFAVHHDILYFDFGRAQSPYTNSFEKWQSRSSGAYLASEAALEKMQSGGHWVPQRRPVDHQLTLAIQGEKIRTFWAYPPLTCHGSYRNTEGNPNVNISCHGCCFSFYNLTTMRPRLVSVDLYDAAGTQWKPHSHWRHHANKTTSNDISSRS